MENEKDTRRKSFKRIWKEHFSLPLLTMSTTAVFACLFGLLARLNKSDAALVFALEQAVAGLYSAHLFIFLALASFVALGAAYALSGFASIRSCVEGMAKFVLSYFIGLSMAICGVTLGVVFYANEDSWDATPFVLGITAVAALVAGTLRAYVGEICSDNLERKKKLFLGVSVAVAIVIFMVCMPWPAPDAPSCSVEAR